MTDCLLRDYEMHYPYVCNKTTHLCAQIIVKTHGKEKKSEWQIFLWVYFESVYFGGNCIESGQDHFTPKVSDIASEWDM